MLAFVNKIANRQTRSLGFELFEPMAGSHGMGEERKQVEGCSWLEMIKRERKSVCECVKVCVCVCEREREREAQA